MKLLFSSPNAAEVGLLKGILDETGIACEIRNENTSSNFPGAEFQAEAWVLDDSDYDRACEMRDDWQKSLDAQPPRAGVAESYRPLNTYFGFLSLAACAFMVWQAARATGRDWAVPAMAALLFAAFSIVAFVAARQMRP